MANARFAAGSEKLIRLTLVRMLSPRGVHVIVTSHYEPTGAFLLECGTDASVSVHAPYFSEADILELVKVRPSPPEEMLSA
jgi:hypothetical protein